MALEREAMQTSDVPAASSLDIGRMLELIKGSTSVELKMTVPDKGHRAAIRGLGFDPVEAQPRQAYFFDTPDLALSKAGMIVRARRIQGGRGDTVVKLRPVDPATIDKSLRRSQGFKIELDAMPGGFVCSASLKGVCTAQEALDATAGGARLSSLFSKEQRGFYAAHAPGDIKMNRWCPWAPPFSSRSGTHQRTSIAASMSKCGSIRMGHGSSRSRRNACRKKASRLQRSSGPTSPSAASR